MDVDPIHPDAETVPPDGPRRDVPIEIGGYRIHRAIASGGMGTVYEATQVNPRRTVALKVLKHGVTSRTSRRRLEYEAQILGRLRHPGIAQIFEAGTHDEGDGAQPFFAMEFIAGAMSITRYAELRSLGTRERIRLFVNVCDAVHHGHQKGIIHRDLKPDNILVDSKGHPKVIDFGVARATDSDMAVTTMRTDVGQLIGTVQYMSPEQVDADPHDLDTRSDVYTLGVILYEVLTGRRPYSVKAASIYEATRVIKEVSPSLPSTVDRRIHGDLETVVMKAMEKNRDRRYQSADELGQDLRRCLDGRPILARPPSLRYQLGLFARNNRALVVGIALVTVGLIAGTVGTTIGMMKAREGERIARDAEIIAEAEARRAGAISTFLRETFASANPELPSETARLAILGEAAGAYAGATGREIAVVDMLRQASTRLDGAFEDAPGVEADLRRTLGRTFLGLGQFAEAESELRRAIALTGRSGDRTDDASDDAIAQLDLDLAEAVDRQARPDEALRILRSSVSEFERRRGSGDDRTLAARAQLADMLLRHGEVEASLEMARDVVDTATSARGARHRETVPHLVRLSEMLWIASKVSESIAAGERAVAAAEAAFGEDDPVTGHAYYVLSGPMRQANRLDEAERYARRSVRNAEQNLGEEHPETLVRTGNLANIVGSAGDLEQAERLLRSVLDVQTRLLSPDAFELQTTRNDLAVCLMYANHNLDEAEALARNAWKSLERAVGAETQMALNAADTYGMVLNRRDKALEAEAVFRMILEVAARRNLQESVPIFAHTGLAKSLVLQSAYDAAEAELDAAVAIVGSDDPDLLLSWQITTGYLDLYRASGDEAKRAEWQAILEASKDGATMWGE